MQTSTEQIAPLGSHQFLDQLNLAYHREVAVRLLSDPQAVLSRARGNLSRWLAEYEDGDEPACLVEWQQLLETRTVKELVAILIDDSDEGQRLRSSTPFPGVLKSEERNELFNYYESWAIAVHGEDAHSRPWIPRTPEQNVQA